MSLLTGSLAMAGLLAVAIPIIIHLLFRRRRRPIEWAAMQFLRDALRKQRKRLQLEQLLLLLVRCLIPIVLGLALAQPLLKSVGALDLGGGRAITFIIDNGLVSALESDDGSTALDAHIQSARHVMEQLGPGDRVSLITTARPARLVIDASSDHASVLRAIRQLEPSDAASDLSGAISLLESSIGGDDATRNTQIAYLLSEFRTGSADLAQALPTLAALNDENTTLIATTPANAPRTNVTVTAVQPARSVLLAQAGQELRQVRIVLSRSGAALPAEVTTVRMESDAIEPVEPGIVNWSAGQEEAAVDLPLALTVSGNRQVPLRVSIDRDALGADNVRYAAPDLRDMVNVLLVHRAGFGAQSTVDRLTSGQWLQRALQPTDDTPIDVVSVEPATLTAGDLRTMDVVVVAQPERLVEEQWAELRGFVDRGGLLMVSPTSDATIHRWVAAFTGAMDLDWIVNVEREDLDKPMLLDLQRVAGSLLSLISADMEALLRPIVVNRRLRVEDATAANAAVIRYEDGLPMLLAASPPFAMDSPDPASPRASRGLAVLFTVAPNLNWTNLPSKPLMVPLVQELVRNGLSQTRSSQRWAVGDQPVLLEPEAQSLAGADGSVIALNDIGRADAPLGRAGVYTVRDRADRAVRAIAVNVQPEAARVEAQSSTAVQTWLEASGAWTITANDALTDPLRSAPAIASLGRTLLIVLLALVLLETLLARWFSHAKHGMHDPRDAALEPTLDEHAATLPQWEPHGGVA
jgi:hypothetical protein